MQALQRRQLVIGNILPDKDQKSTSLWMSKSPTCKESGRYAPIEVVTQNMADPSPGTCKRKRLLSPGPIATPMQAQVLDEEGKRQFESLIPRGKMGRPEEIATVALFLASDDSSFVNGVELSVDGGLSAI